jgi:HlyD family secretion protein
MIRDSSTMDRPVERPGRFSRKRWLQAGGAVALIAMVAAIAPSAIRWLGSEVSVDASRIRIGRVTRGDLVRDLSVQGNVVAAFHPTLFSPARGIARIEVTAGTQIEPGDVLARVESPELESRLEQERSNLLSMQADYERQRILAKQTQVQTQQDIGLLEVELEAARRAMSRAERSRDEGILNDVEYEAAQDGVRIATLKLDLARQRADFETESLDLETQNRLSQVERQRLVATELERQVAELLIRSPVAGLVSRVQIDDQDAVSQGSPIVSVVDLSAFELEISVPEIYADEIGADTTAVISYNGREFAGRVKSLSPEVEGSRVEGIVAFVDEVPKGLKQNQRLSTRLVLQTLPDVLKVPRGPFLEGDGGRQAYVLEDSVAVLRPIEVGGLSVSEVEIRDGLEVGDRIIVSDTTRFEGAKTILIRD